MECASPIWIAETSDHYGTYVPCGRCWACIQTKRSVWTFRLLEELKQTISAFFVTLTYNEKNIPDNQSLKKKELQNFIKALRTAIQTDYPSGSQWLKQSDKTQKWSPKLRYFACGEYGGKTKRPHYHAILYDIPTDYIQPDPIYNNSYSPKLEKIWNKGQIQIGNVERASAHYMTKHHMFPLSEETLTDKQEKPFSIMSRRPGIGNKYITDEIKNYYHSTKNSFITLPGGIKQPLGRYYKDKIYGVGQIRKEIQLQTASFIAEKERKERESFASETDYNISKQNTYNYNTKKVKRIIRKNNKL